jgi:hypothetical protein
MEFEGFGYMCPLSLREIIRLSFGPLSLRERVRVRAGRQWAEGSG